MELDDELVDELADYERALNPEVDSPEDDFEDDDEAQGKPFVANEAQSKFRMAAISGLYDTLIAAGTISSSKTYGIIALIIDLCLEYQDTSVLVVRARWDTLIDNTIPDFVDILSAFPSEFYSWPNKLNLRFWNGSHIQFRPAREQQDPNFGWLKGKKFDILFGDEYDHFSPEFISMAQSRVGVQRRRRRPDAPICPPMSIFACNPNISHPKEFYDKHIHNNALLVAARIYFQVFTIQDNIEFITQEKIAQWKRVMTPPMYKRFVEGSWDAMSDLEQLIPFEYMDRCKEIIPPKKDKAGNVIPWAYYLGVDPARYGPDRCSFLIMNGPNFYRLEFLAQSSIPEIYEHTKKLMFEFNISTEHVTIDVIGLGAGVVDMFHAEAIYVQGFNGAESPDDAAFYQENPEDVNSRVQMDNYHFTFLNKRAQAYWEGMQMMRDGRIGGFNPEVLGWHDDLNLYEMMRQDIASIHYQFQKGTKAIKIEDKEEIKKRLKRSPDFSDVYKFALRSYLYDLKKTSMEVISF